MGIKSQPQNVIAIVCDLDHTLVPRDSEYPIFDHFGISEDAFWKDVNSRHVASKDTRKKQLEQEEEKFPVDIRVPVSQERADISSELVYANVILEYVRKGIFKGLNRNLLRELGKKIDFFPGVPDFIQEIKEMVKSNPAWNKHDIKVEFYIVSSALADMIRGSKISKFCDGIFATEIFPKFGDDQVNGEIDHISFSVSYTEKTRFIHMIHKGFDVSVNDFVPANLRRVRGDCIIYIGDGLTDVPPMATTNHLGGKSIAVYNDSPGDPKTEKRFQDAVTLRDHGRVFNFGPADFRQGQQTRKTLELLVQKAANRIAEDIEKSVKEGTGRSPRLGE
ncbi:MAG TPA: hypothetical protein VJA47_00065 [archaeon]|nr:hypothetical protein [archaeon]